MLYLQGKSNGTLRPRQGATANTALRPHCGPWALLSPDSTLLLNLNWRLVVGRKLRLTPEARIASALRNAR